MTKKFQNDKKIPKMTKMTKRQNDKMTKCQKAYNKEIKTFFIIY